MALGGPLTRHECDRVMRLLAIACPSSGITPQEAHDKLELYFLLLNEAGVTGNMLGAAAKRYAMAPTKGKPHWFPDAGQLAELCADDLRARRDALAALNGALAVLDGRSTPAAVEPEHGFDAGAHLRELGEKMRVKGAVPRASDTEIHRPAPATPSTARSSTDADELREHLAKKTGSAR
ncbi:MAG TPA: hypothetical protein DEQ40_09165 [Oxalobacteraceae bacterium]|nr:hypothetical protein [Oxalobacteraceae bacterium]